MGALVLLNLWLFAIGMHVYAFVVEGVILNDTCVTVIHRYRLLQYLPRKVALKRLAWRSWCGIDVSFACTVHYDRSRADAIWYGEDKARELGVLRGWSHRGHMKRSRYCSLNGFGVADPARWCSDDKESGWYLGNWWVRMPVKGYCCRSHSMDCLCTQTCMQRCDWVLKHLPVPKRAVSS